MTSTDDQVVAEWFGEGREMSRPGEAQPGSDGVVQERIESAAERAEAAMERGTVSKRYEPLLRRYFERLPRAIEEQRRASDGRPVAPARESE